MTKWWSHKNPETGMVYWSHEDDVHGTVHFLERDNIVCFCGLEVPVGLRLAAKLGEI